MMRVVLVYYTELDVLRLAFSRCCGKSTTQTSSSSAWFVLRDTVSLRYSEILSSPLRCTLGHDLEMVIAWWSFLLILVYTVFSPRNAHAQLSITAVSVRLSVTEIYCVKTVEHIELFFCARQCSTLLCGIRISPKMTILSFKTLSKFPNFEFWRFLVFIVTPCTVLSA